MTSPCIQTSDFPLCPGYKAFCTLFHRPDSTELPSYFSSSHIPSSPSTFVPEYSHSLSFTLTLIHLTYTLPIMLSHLVSICTLALLSLCPWTSSASPAYPHQGITFARRQVPTNPASSESCYPLLLAEAEKLPAWGKVKQYIDAAFGEGVQSIRLNDPEHPNETAESCLTGSALPVNYEGELYIHLKQPTCTTSTVTAKGIVDDVKHTITFVEDIGVEDKLSWTVTTAAVLVQGVKVNVNYELPGLTTGGGDVQSPITSTFTNLVSETYAISLLPLSLSPPLLSLSSPSSSY
ncbi:hypothetical protein NMY22_g16592 [Coprinellus aureogranulatus]|nr:hypothetical protein NMY22_g16592 [Coprinellus aureogranulatus]